MIGISQQIKDKYKTAKLAKLSFIYNETLEPKT